MWNLKDSNKVVGIQNKVFLSAISYRSIHIKNISRLFIISNHLLKFSNHGDLHFHYPNLKINTINVFLFYILLVNTL